MKPYKNYSKFSFSKNLNSNCERENRFSLEMCKKYGCDYILIDDEYKVDINWSIYLRESDFHAIINKWVSSQFLTIFII